MGVILNSECTRLTETVCRPNSTRGRTEVLTKHITNYLLAYHSRISWW